MTWLYKFNEEEQEEDYEGGLEIEVEFEDVKAYLDAFDKCKEVFFERRERFGNFLDNSRRHPLINISGLYEKCMRFLLDVEARKEIFKDTLIDLVNYALFEIAKIKDYNG